MTDKVLIVIGKTMSGKTTYVQNELIPQGYTQVITHTTRPRRATESKTAYHFETAVHGETLALREFDMIGGHVAYWTTTADILATPKPVIIIDVQGAIELVRALGDNAVIRYLNTPNDIIRERLTTSSRGVMEDEQESMRRYADDVMQFAKLDRAIAPDVPLVDLSARNFIKINQER